VVAALGGETEDIVVERNMAAAAGVPVVVVAEEGVGDDVS
jgi:hypothetical protein